MKCKYCGQNFRTSVDDRCRNRNSGDFSPKYWQTEYNLSDDDVREIGFDPDDNSSFICYDCEQKFFDKHQELAKTHRSEWEDEDGVVRFKIKKPTFTESKKSIKERRIFPRKNEGSLDEGLFEDHITAIGLLPVAHDKNRYIYITPGNGDFYLIVNRPGYDGNLYQMYLIDAREMHKMGLTIDDFKLHKVFDPDTTVGLIAVYEALANGFSEEELARDMTEIEMLIHSKAATLHEDKAPTMTVKSFVKSEYFDKKYDADSFLQYLADEFNIYEEDVDKKYPLTDLQSMYADFEENEAENLNESERDPLNVEAGIKQMFADYNEGQDLLKNNPIPVGTRVYRNPEVDEYNLSKYKYSGYGTIYKVIPYNGMLAYQIEWDCGTKGGYTADQFNVLNESRALKEAIREEFFDCEHYPMSINSVADFIASCEARGNVAILTVNSSNGGTWHSQFDSKSWLAFKNSINGVDEFSRRSNLKGAAITKVWAKECNPKETLGESKKLKEAHNYGQTPERIEIDSEDCTKVRKFIRPIDQVRVGDVVVDAYDGNCSEFLITNQVKETYTKTMDNGPGQRVYGKTVHWYEVDDPLFLVRVTYDNFMEEETVELFSKDYMKLEGIEM